MRKCEGVEVWKRGSDFASLEVRVFKIRTFLRSLEIDDQINQIKLTVVSER